jgi:LysM repeat protein
VLVNEPVTDITPAASYTVKSGDNLWTIAKKNNTTVAQLTAANNLPAGANLRPGQKLIIPGKSGSSSAGVTAMAAPGSTPKIIDPQAGSAAPRASTDVVKHIVKSGETLGGIARKYEVRQGDIAVANNISDPAKIRPGMELIIPGWRSPSGKTGKTSQKTTANGSTKTAAPAASANVEPAPSVPAEPAATPLPPVPVIRLDDGPAPKQP